MHLAWGGNPKLWTSNEGIAGNGMLMYMLLNEEDCIVMKGVRYISNTEHPFAGRNTQHITLIGSTDII